MGGLMSALGGSSMQGGDSATGDNKQRSGLHITTGGSDTGASGGGNSVVMIAAIAAAGFVIYSIAAK